MVRVARSREAVADILIARFGVGEEQLAEARQLAAASETRLELVLSELGLVTDAQMALAMAQYLEMPAISLANFTPNEELLHSLPSRIMKELHVIPLARWNSCFAVAMPDPFDVVALEELSELLDGDVVPYVAPRDEVTSLLQRYESDAGNRLEEVIRDVDGADLALDMGGGDDDINVDEMLETEGDVPVVRIVNSVLIEALHRGASDIHIEPMEKDMLVRYRIDGVLYDEPSPPKYMQWAITSRLKIIANMDIAERRLPQDGRFTIHAPGRDVDVRVSLIPTVHGQKAVLRILDKLNLKPNLAALDLDPADYDKLIRAVHQPSGLILVTGPTGSGKTTTLYSGLQELNEPTVNIVTVEDPVEYQLPRVNQVQTNSAIGLTFANGLRSILRQDPDVVMIGEIRDHETATIAVQAALTGHLVLSTLHTNDAAGAVARLVHMGVEPFLIASSLALSQAQRIYRRLCPACKRQREIPWDVLQQNSIDCDLFRSVKLYKPYGCLHCNHIGYSGREAAMEILEVDDEIRGQILSGATAAKIRETAVGKGMLTLREAGLRRVRKGITSIEEILRVTTQ